MFINLNTKSSIHEFVGFSSEVKPTLSDYQLNKNDTLYEQDTKKTWIWNGEKWIESLDQAITRQIQAVIQTTSEKKTRCYNVLDYGLVADANGRAENTSFQPTDNTEALVNLLAIVPNGSIIYFPVGTYGFASGILIDKDVTFLGENCESQSANPANNRPHDPMSILRYVGKKANTTMFTRASGYHDVSFINLTLDGGESYKITANTTKIKESDIRYEMLVESATLENVNGLDLSVHSPGIIRNCQFWGFSGFALRMSMHKYVESCGFFCCNKCIVTTFTDSVLHHLWFCKSNIGIYLSEIEEVKTNEKGETEDITKHSASVNVSDTWADQMVGHFIESDPLVTSVQLITSNVWLDHIQKSAFYFPNALLAGSRISGTFGRIGMNYAGLADAQRTAAIAIESDFMVCGRFMKSCIFDLNISNVEGKCQSAEKENRDCFSRLFTTLEPKNDKGQATISNSDIKIKCSKFGVSKLWDQKTGTSPWIYTEFDGNDGFNEIYGATTYVNGFATGNTSPLTKIKAPKDGYLYYVPEQKALYRSTAAQNASAWEEVFNMSDLEARISALEAANK